MTGAWLRAAEERNRMMAPPTERMFALAGIHEGARVLDIGAGTGDTALMIAARVGPSGAVVATDVAEPMVNATTDAARAAGLTNVSARRMDAASLDLQEHSFDAAVARHVLMFVNDLASVLTGVRRVLRPGARFAATTWAELERNSFNAIVIDAVRSRGKLPARRVEVVRAFSLSDPVHLREAFARAGLIGCVVERVAGSRVFKSVDAALGMLRDVPLYHELMSDMSADERAATLEAVGIEYRGYVGAGGECALPMECLVVAGAA
jgi:SAM-dependent methyltransferase